VPSGWTDSGIDWTSTATMRNSRTEDIVRHLYLAINERDYWMRLNSGEVGSLDRVGRFRTDQQLRYIYSKLKSWFKPLSEYNLNSSFTFDNSESLFIDDNITPQDPVNKPSELFYFGYNSYDYKLNGNLETLISEDLSFLRDYGTYSFRVLLDDLHKVYKILNLDLRNRVFGYSHSYSGFTGSTYNVLQFPNNSTQSMANSFKKGDDADDDPENPNSARANTLFYNQTLIEYSNFISNKYTGYWQVIWGSNLQNYVTAQEKHGIKFSPIGFDSLQYQINDFNFKSFSFGFVDNPGFDDDFNILPTNAYTLGHEVIQNQFINVASSPVVFFGGIHGFIHSDYVTSGLPVATRAGGLSQKSVQDSDAIPFINLNIEGFLNYYTEPTP